MEYIRILLVGIGLSLDVFAYCLYRGAVISEIRRGDLAKIIGMFTVFQVGMLAIGSCLTRIPAIEVRYRSVNQLWVGLASAAFILLGILMILKAYRRRHIHPEEKKNDTLNIHALLFWCLLTSVDALIAGIGFGLLGFKLLLCLLLLAAITVLSVIVGIVCGYRMGCGPMNKFVLIGGLLVMIGGIDVLVRFLAVVA